MNVFRNFVSLAAVIMVVFCSVLSAAEGGAFYAQGPRDKKTVSLTFDDGPGLYTEKILEILGRYGVKATFFMEGSQVERYPDIARKVREGGHEIGNHTYSHKNFYAYVKPDHEKVLVEEIERSETFIRQATGVAPYLLRMPHGYMRSWIKPVAARKGYVIVNWTFGCDWKKMSSEELIAAYVKSIQRGAIFLMHDGGKNRQRTADALPALIEAIQKQGYEIVPVGELLNLNQGSLVTKD